ncbi:alpha/beta hydrolase [Bradyrhizobium vignae]|nr:alpha/beta hydrolase [Bradyrhizobium vignae]
MAAPATHCVKSGDVHLAYQVLGNRPLDLVFVPGFVSHVEASWHVAERSAFFRRLASFVRLILFDTRRTGTSDRVSQIFTLEQRMHDVQTSLEKVGSERAVLFGASEGGGPCLQSALRPLILHRIGDRWLEIEHARSLLLQQLRCLTGGVS